MKSKEFDIDRMYLIHCPYKGYYHHGECAWSQSKDTAVRFLKKDTAEEKARVLNGTVEEEVLTPEVMCRIIQAKKQGIGGGTLVRFVLDGLHNSEGEFCDKKELTLGGKTVSLEEIKFTAAGRYADILYAANNLIESYYKLMASDHYYRDYDPERDNAGMAEYEAYFQLIELYEDQLRNFAVLYHSAYGYLKRAIMYLPGQKNAGDRSEAVISLFSNAVVSDFQMDPDKCFELFKAAEAQFPIIYEMTGKNGR